MEPALTCPTRRRRRTALFALRATATSDPLFRCAVVLQNEDSQPLIAHSCTTSFRSCKRGGRRTCLQRQASYFLLLCSALLAVLLASCRGALSCACGARVKLRCSARLCAVCLLLLHSALDVVARRAALKYAAPCCSRRWAASVPALRSRTGRSGGVAVMGRRGGPPLGERPWPLMTGESAGYTAGPCGVLRPFLT